MSTISQLDIDGILYDIEDEEARQGVSNINNNIIPPITQNIQTLFNSVGGPNTAATRAAMTDTTKVYVYTGNESGMTNGNWYYYNGTSWVSGGIYNSVAVDNTLTTAGASADAKAVGDYFRDLGFSVVNGKVNITWTE